jgi:hypothetical protein
MYGNDLAVECAANACEAGLSGRLVLALVTWAQVEDPRWFGAKIGGHVKSLEFVTVPAPQNGRPSYFIEV